MLVYLAQLSHESGQVYQNHCFPLAVGFIGAYLKKEFGDSVEVELFKSPVELNTALIHQVPEVIMFSNYMWNCNLSIAFAEKIRADHEDVLIVMGGPNISSDSEKRRRFLKTNSAIDLYVVYEGERAAKIILAHFLAKKNRSEAKTLRHPSIVLAETNEDHQIAYNDSVLPRRFGTEGEPPIGDLPSPYLTHIMDKFFRDGEVPLVETNRGCPFSCVFCQQGMGYYNRVVNHSIERVKQEIAYIARYIRDNECSIHTLEIADSNFGMYKRDRQVCQAIREAQDAMGFPKTIGSSTGKNKADLIVDNLDVVQRGSMLIRSAIQSTHPETLRAIRRQNIKQSVYVHIQQEINARGMENNADLMLGLPMETKASHVKAVYDLIDSGVKEFSCLQTIILNGTVMESDHYRKEFGILTKYRIIPECFGEYDILGEKKRVREVEEIIITTDTMSFEDYLDCRKLHLLVMIFHNTRLLNLIYDILDDAGIRKSAIIQNIHDLHDARLNDLVGAFISDTKSELFDTVEAIDSLPATEENLSHNKIFKHLAKALFNNKALILDVVRRVSADILGAAYSAAMAEIMPILEASIVNPFEQIREYRFEIRSEKLKSITGSRVHLKLSDNQAAIITAINNLYHNPEDKINKMVYKLRPKNLMYTIHSDNDRAGN